MKINHNYYLDLAFNLAKINLGKTKMNPAVGCVIVKNGSVISSGFTSVGGRPHAEYNALNRNLNFNNADLYVTMEPCTHYGLTKPCTDLIKKKGIKNVYYSFDDVDYRTSKKAVLTLKKEKIRVFKKNSSKHLDFYKSYFINKNRQLPYIDAKIAISKDYYTINKKKKWITNFYSRLRGHLIRSRYDSIISTATTINKDNALLNNRINGFDLNKPDLIIIDIKLKIKKKIRLFNLSNKRKILIVTSSSNNNKISYFKKKGIKFIKIKSLTNRNDFLDLLKLFKKKGYNRTLVEAGLTFLNTLVKNKIITNLYIFQSPYKLGKFGKNNAPISLLKQKKLIKKIKVNLYEDSLYKIRIK